LKHLAGLGRQEPQVWTLVRLQRASGNFLAGGLIDQHELASGAFGDHVHGSGRELGLPGSWSVSPTENRCAFFALVLDPVRVHGLSIPAGKPPAGEDGAIGANATGLMDSVRRLSTVPIQIDSPRTQRRCERLSLELEHPCRCGDFDAASVG
jgi:hypothetical protein